MGGPGSTGKPNAHGFDHFFGHLCQRVAHNHYTDHLWRDGRRVDFEGNTADNLVGRQYATDLMAEDALRFIRDHKDGPFFLDFATPLPHVSLQVPADSMRPYVGTLDDAPYDGKKGYLPHETPHAAYAGMVSRVDDYVGRIMACSANSTWTRTPWCCSRATTARRSASAAPTRRTSIPPTDFAG